MPWTLGNEIHVDNLHARENVHIDGDAITLSTLAEALTGADHGIGIGALHFNPATMQVTYSTSAASSIGNVTSAELEHLVGVSGPIQAQIDGKQAVGSYQVALEAPVVATASGIGNLTLTSSAGYNTLLTYTPPDLSALAPKASPSFTGDVTLPSTTTIGNVSSTELSYLNGVTTAIQPQLDSKADAVNPAFSGIVNLASTSYIRFGNGVVEDAYRGHLPGNSGDVTIKTITLTNVDNLWNLASVSVEYAVMNDFYGHPFGPGKQVCSISISNLHQGGYAGVGSFGNVYHVGQSSNLSFTIGNHTFSGGNDWTFPIRVANGNSVTTSIVLKLTVMATSGTISIA
jgi:hypothetical protein